jgi:hypothetical protein
VLTGQHSLTDVAYHRLVGQGFGGVAINSIFSLKGWLGDAVTAIENSRNSAGMMGALQNSKRKGINGAIYNNAAGANALAMIASSSVVDRGVLAAEMAAANEKKRIAEKLSAALDPLRSKPAPPKQLLDPVIYYGNGSSLDTTSNILTRTDGVQIDITTGREYIDPANLIRMANGAYLDTKNNILTLSDGTKINTITHLTITA